MPLSHSASRWTLVAVGLLASYWVALFVGTHWPGDALAPLAGRGGDKWIHAGAFAGLAFLLAVVVGWQDRPGGLAYLAMWGALALYGAADEWTQSFVGRTSDWKDWVADLLGAALGLACYAAAAALWPLAPDDRADSSTPPP